ncbi:MAG TPA: phosphatase PAP2 family protein [Chitinophagaceae bacterium]|jgi:undecaprenyl-diphosphatase
MMSDSIKLLASSSSNNIKVKQRIEFIVAIGICVLTLMLFLMLSQNVLFNKESSFDTKAFLWLNQFSPESHAQLARSISFFGTGNFLIPAYLLIVVYLIKTKNVKNAIQIIAFSGFSLILGWVLKELFKRPRPLLVHLDAAGGYSFPSGHTLGGFTFCGIMILLIYRSSLTNTLKMILCFTFLLMACLIGISRIYLHVHYASDTLASFYIAVCLLSLFFLAVQWPIDKTDDPLVRN